MQYIVILHAVSNVTSKTIRVDYFNHIPRHFRKERIRAPPRNVPQNPG